MTHTIRIYNKPNRIFDWWHPYQQLCCGNCHYCKDLTKSTKKRRLTYKYDLRKELKQLFSNAP